MSQNSPTGATFLPQENPVVNPIGYIVSLKDGIPSFTNREVEGLAQRGLRIDLYATKKGKGLYAPAGRATYITVGALIAGNLYFLITKPRRYIHAFAEARKLGSIRELAAGASFGMVLAKRGTKLIHAAFGDRKLFVGYYSSKLTGIPLTSMVHSHELAFYMNAPTFRRALSECQTIFTVCDYNKEILAKDFPELTDKIVVSRLFVDPKQFASDARLRTLTVAKFHDYKGYDVLMKAAEILKGENVVFWIVGDGPLDVRDLVQKGGLEEKVLVLGPVSEEVLKILYQSCDIFCLPSKTAASGQKEGVPVSIMEAMAFSKPIVSTRHAGIPELVPSELVEENNPEQLAEAIMRYASNPEKRRMDGERNRRLILDSYSPKNLQTIESKFRGLLQGDR